MTVELTPLAPPQQRAAATAPLPARTPPPSAPRDRRHETPLEHTVENSAAFSPTLLLFTLLAAAGVLAYTVFLLTPEHRGDVLPYALVISAELILLTQAVISMWTILSGAQDPRGFSFHEAQRRLYDQSAIAERGVSDHAEAWPLQLNGSPIAVDVYITTYGEDLATVRRTVAAAMAITGLHSTWVLDDGKSDEVYHLAREFGAGYIRREGNENAKAGNLNHAIAHTRGDFFLILDADFVARPEILHETLPFFAESTVAFVQTPQAYGNMRNLISKGAGYMQSVFYRFIQPGRNRFNAAFCVGTNVVFRRAAIEDVGGIYTDSKSEDVWTSLMLHENGWRSVFIPVTLAVGDAPETVEAYTKQQLRWATGGFEILLTRNPFSPRRRLTADQRIQYTVTATHYLSGIAPLLLLIVPPLEIYFDLRPMNLTITWQTWLISYIGFYGLQVLLAVNTMGSFKPQTIILSTASFPIYVRALTNVIAGVDQNWHATGSLGRKASPFNFMIPQVAVFIFLALTSVIALNQDWSDGVFHLATAWNLTNTAVFAAFIYAALKEARR